MVEEIEDLDPGWVPEYGETFFNALKHTFLLATGDFADGGYEFAKDNSFATWFLLQFCFFYGIVYLVIHLMNMVIALMGNTLSEDIERSSIQMYKSRLLFVLENWYSGYMTDIDKARTTHLITAHIKSEDSKELKAISELTNNISKIKEKVDLIEAAQKI